MRAEEKQYIETEVKVTIMPEIKASIPTLVGWILRAVFPKLEVKLVILISRIVELILLNRKNEGKRTIND